MNCSGSNNVKKSFVIGNKHFIVDVKSKAS